MEEITIPITSKVLIQIQIDDELEVPISPTEMVSNSKVIWKLSRPNLLKVKDEYFNDQFLEWKNKNKKEISNKNNKEIPSFVTQLIPETYCFPLFNQHFCYLLLQEIDSYLEASQRYGMGVRPLEFGFGSFIQTMCQEHLLPLIQILFPEYRQVRHFEDIYSKIVKYNLGEDEDWPAHVDVSELTINICLGREFKGSNLLLYGTRNSNSDDDEIQNCFEYVHIPGQLIIHKGSNRHSVSFLKSGTRENFVILLNKPVFQTE